MADHEKFKEIKNKYDKHFSEKPGKQINMPKKKKVKKVKKFKKVKSTNKVKLSLKSVEKKSTIPGPDEKPEIKKIKKQPTEKRVYNLKDFVVYPKHGVGKITAIEKAKKKTKKKAKKRRRKRRQFSL